jgi:hypothetical protein
VFLACPALRPLGVARSPGRDVDAAAGRPARVGAGVSPVGLSPTTAVATVIATPTAAATPSLDIRCRQPRGLFPASRPWCAGGAHRAGGMLGGLLAAGGRSALADPDPAGSHDPINPRATQGADMGGSRATPAPETARCPAMPGPETARCPAMPGPETARCPAMPGRASSGPVTNIDPVSSVARPTTNSR